MNTQDKIKIMQAYVDGATVECSRIADGLWWLIPEPEWHWETLNYRIKPEKTGSDIVRDMLADGLPVLCGVSSTSQSFADQKAKDMEHSGLVFKLIDDGYFMLYHGRAIYASPVDTSRIASYVPEAE